MWLLWLQLCGCYGDSRSNVLCVMVVFPMTVLVNFDSAFSDVYIASIFTEPELLKYIISFINVKVLIKYFN